MTLYGPAIELCALGDHEPNEQHKDRDRERMLMQKAFARNSDEQAGKRDKECHTDVRQHKVARRKSSSYEKSQHYNEQES